MPKQSDYHFEGATPEKLAGALARSVMEKRKQAQKANNGDKQEETPKPQIKPTPPEKK